MPDHAAGPYFTWKRGHMKLQKLTKAFVEHFGIISNKVGNNPFGLSRLLLEHDPQLRASRLIPLSQVGQYVV